MAEHAGGRSGGTPSGRATEAERAFRRHLGEAVRAHRLRNGWTQAALAARSGLSEKFLCRVERGGVGTSAWVAVRIAAALGVGAGELFGGSGAALLGGERPVPPDVARFLYLMHATAPEERRRIYSVVRALVRPTAAGAGPASASERFKVPRARARRAKD